MIGFVRSEQRQLTTAFDQCVVAGQELLKLPQVQTELGVFAVSLQDALDSSFLPNYRDGRLTLPREQQQTDNIGLLPLLPSLPDTLTLDAAFSKATPYKVTQSIQATGVDFQDSPSCEGIVRMERHIRGKTIAHAISKGDVAITSRSVIFTPVVGEIVLHELVHAVNMGRFLLPLAFAVSPAVRLRYGVGDEVQVRVVDNTAAKALGRQPSQLAQVSQKIWDELGSSYERTPDIPDSYINGLNMMGNLTQMVHSQLTKGLDITAILSRSMSKR